MRRENRERARYDGSNIRRTRGLKRDIKKESPVVKKNSTINRVQDPETKVEERD